MRFRTICLYKIERKEYKTDDAVYETDYFDDLVEMNFDAIVFDHSDLTLEERTVLEESHPNTELIDLMN